MSQDGILPCLLHDDDTYSRLDHILNEVTAQLMSLLDLSSTRHVKEETGASIFSLPSADTGGVLIILSRQYTIYTVCVHSLCSDNCLEGFYALG